MKKIIFFVLFTLSITSNAYANMYAGVKFNANMQEKLVLFDTNFFDPADYYMTDGFVLGSHLFVGYDLAKSPLRLELELSVLQLNDETTNFTSHDIQILANAINLGLNTFYDYYLHEKVAIYGGAGVGLVTGLTIFTITNTDTSGYFNSTSTNTKNAVNFGLSANIGIGTSFAINEKLVLDLGYRYLYLINGITEMKATDFSTSFIKIEGGDGINVGVSQIQLGLRYNF